MYIRMLVACLPAAEDALEPVHDLAAMIQERMSQRRGVHADCVGSAP
jgi:hypothetical protein